MFKNSQVGVCRFFCPRQCKRKDTNELREQLLAEIKHLAETPLDNPSKQANKVKEYRKTWNSLGHADEEIDKKLNED